LCCICLVFFFFQAEDGIRDRNVTGVQTCALPICVHLVADQPVVVEHAVSGFTEALFEAVIIVLGISFLSLGLRAGLVVAIAIPRSEERRVGKGRSARRALSPRSTADSARRIHSQP